MKNFVATHVGKLVGDSRAGGVMPIVKLRETPKFWITEHGTKFRKNSGWPTGDDPFPMWHLDLKSIEQIT